MRKVGKFQGTMLRLMAGAMAPQVLIGGMVAGVALSATPTLASEAKMSNSPEFAKAAGPLQKTLSGVQPLIAKYQAAPADGKAAAQAAMKAALVSGNARAQLTDAEAAIKNPMDRQLAGQWAVMMGAITEDMVLYQHGLQNVVDAGLGTPAERQANQAKLGFLSYQNQDYTTAVKVLTPLVAANASDDNVPVVLAVSYVNLNQSAQALAALKTAVDARRAAGAAVPKDWFMRANAIAFNGKLSAQGNEWAQLLAANDPTPENLLIAETLVRDYSSYDNPEVLDCVRLAWRSGAMTVKSDATVQEYRQFLSAADPRRYPGEVLSVVDAGVAIGALAANATAVSEPRATASKLVAADRASLPAFYKDALAPQASGKTIVAAADALLSYGENAKAAELYQLALAKPGIDTNTVLNRLGMAQVGAGDYAGAQATLAKVEGRRKPLAGLWSIYAKAKAAGK